MEIEAHGNEYSNLIEQFRRPKKHVGLKDPIDIMLIDIDACVIESNSSNGDKAFERSEIRIYGIDRDEATYLLHVHDFKTYLYVQKPNDIELNEDDRNKMIDELDRLTGCKIIHSIEVVDRVSISDFRLPSEGFSQFLKITIYNHSKMSKLRAIFEKDFRFNNKVFPSQTYDSNLDYRLRFMVDKGLSGNGWLTIPGNRYSHTKKNEKVSSCSFEFDINEGEIIGRSSTEKNYAFVAPMRIMSFDIEVENTIGFPSPDKNPVITIACYCCLHDTKLGEKKVIFQLDTCEEIFDATLFTFKNERTLLETFDDFIEAYDPDIILGFNIISFDLNYLLERRKALAIEPATWGRLTDDITVVKKDKFQSKMMGFRELLNINTPGRIQIDMLAHMMREKKLRSYSLNYVSFYFLGEQKEDVSYKIISSLQRESAVTRKRIATYCLKDAILPLVLFEKLKCIYSYVEMARVTGVPLTYLLFKGQQIKIISQLYRATREKQYLVPYFKKNFGAGDDSVRYQGADVLEPKRGFYDTPIATLDFASLYPSIMISHNMCYSTLLKNRDDKNKVPGEFVHITPTGHCFAKTNVRKGVLPEILENLISARKQTRIEMENIKSQLQNLGENDECAKQKRELENMMAVLDGRQLALKISANSVYGFTGAAVGSLPSIEIASSVTSIGRQMIDKTRNFIMSHFTIDQGFKINADVIYGDTDSVMINFGVNDVSEAMQLGKLAAELLSAEYIKPIKLEFEKIYYPYLLLNKKRYAGLLWTKPEKPDKKDMKGVESVRRDNCQLASSMVDKVLDILLLEKDIEKAKNYVKSKVADLQNGNVDISLLIITKGISKDIESDGYKIRQPHVELAKKLQIRKPEVKFCIGDRIPFVILKGKANSKNFENSEDPEHAFNNDLPLDLEYYLEKQVRPPLERIFEVICNPKEIFEGDHTRKTKQQTVSAKQGIGAFYKSVAQCMSCKKELEKKIENKAVCTNCAKTEQSLYFKRIIEMKGYESDFSRAWSECQRCDGTFTQEVRCNNTDCIIYFRRTKVKKEIQNFLLQINRFN